MRIADPPPGFCSVCFGANPDRRYVDFQADYDGAPVLNPETNTIAVLPWNGQLGGHDNLYICENCVRDAAELIAFKAEMHRRQLQEIKQLEVERDHWKQTARRLKRELDAQLDSAFGPPRRRDRVAA